MCRVIRWASHSVGGQGIVLAGAMYTFRSLILSASSGVHAITLLPQRYCVLAPKLESSVSASVNSLSAAMLLYTLLRDPLDTHESGKQEKSMTLDPLVYNSR